MLGSDRIKVRLIDFLLSTNTNNSDLIASEVSFFHGYRRADIVKLSGGKTYSFEVKSDRDNLRKLNFQLEDYQSTFQFCYVVTTNKHLKGVREATPKKVGIIHVDEDSVRVLRKPKENKRLSKHSLVLGMLKRDIYSLLCNSKRNNDIHEARNILEAKESSKLLAEYFYNSLLEKYKKKYNSFLSDRGEKTSLTDLYYLQSNY